MRQARIALAAALFVAAQLAFGWRLSVAGAAPDIVFPLVAMVTLRVNREWVVPAACAIGLAADLMVGSRLGLLALGYAAGTVVVSALHPFAKRAGSALAAAVVVGAGTAAAHGVAAGLGSLWGDLALSLGERFLRALMIAFLSVPLAPAGWAVASLLVGTRPAASREKTRFLEA